MLSSRLVKKHCFYIMRAGSLIQTAHAHCKLATTQHFSKRSAPTSVKMAASKVTVDEKDVLLLFRDFLEESGQYESLVPFERSTGIYPRRLPAKFASLREVVLWGDLDELKNDIFEPFRNLGDENGLNACRYAIAKQRYLESLLQINTDKASLQERLAEVEKLCPSSEEFEALLSLVTLPSLSASPEYKDWSVEKGRLQCFYQLASLTNEAKCGLTLPSSVDPPEQRLSKNRLVQLIAKGHLYEQCEAIYSHPSTSSQAAEEDKESFLQLLDLYNWIKQQPDSAFQLSPATLQFEVLCCKPTVQREESSERSNDALSESMQPLLTELEEESSHTKTDSDSNKQNSTAAVDQQASSGSATAVGKTDKSAPHETKEVELNSKSEPKDCYKSKSATQAEFLTSNSHRKSSVETGVREATLPSAISAPLLPALLVSQTMGFEDNFTGESGAKKGRKSSTPKPSRTMGFEDNFTGESGAAPVEITPPRDGAKKGRKSSTPKPSSTGEMVLEPPSFSSSPVPHLSSVLEDESKAAEDDHSVPSAKRHIDFSENLEESVVFPTSKLLAHVKDKQVNKVTLYSKHDDQHNIVSYAAYSLVPNVFA